MSTRDLAPPLTKMSNDITGEMWSLVGVVCSNSNPLRPRLPWDNRASGAMGTRSHPPTSRSSEHFPRSSWITRQMNPPRNLHSRASKQLPLQHLTLASIDSRSTYTSTYTKVMSLISSPLTGVCLSHSTAALHCCCLGSLYHYISGQVVFMF